MTWEDAYEAWRRAKVRTEEIRGAARRARLEYTLTADPAWDRQLHQLLSQLDHQLAVEASALFTWNQVAKEERLKQ